jgi:hypothetical protein
MASLETSLAVSPLLRGPREGVSAPAGSTDPARALMALPHPLPSCSGQFLGATPTGSLPPSLPSLSPLGHLGAQQQQQHSSELGRSKQQQQQGLAKTPSKPLRHTSPLASPLLADHPCASAPFSAHKAMRGAVLCAVSAFAPVDSSLSCLLFTLLPHNKLLHVPCSMPSSGPSLRVYS